MFNMRKIEELNKRIDTLYEETRELRKEIGGAKDVWAYNLGSATEIQVEKDLRGMSAINAEEYNNMNKVDLLLKIYHNLQKQRLGIISQIESIKSEIKVAVRNELKQSPAK